MKTSEYVELIKKVRKQKDISQQEVADFLGMAQQSYGQIELGKQLLKQSDFEKICEFLGLSPIVMADPGKKVFQMTEEEFELIKKTNEILSRMINEIVESNPTVNITGDKNKVVIHGTKVNKK